MVKSLFDQLNDIVAVCRDPGILERRQKVWGLRFQLAVTKVVYASLGAFAETGMSLADACKHASEQSQRSTDQLIADIEAIDKPMPEGKTS